MRPELFLFAFLSIASALPLETEKSPNISLFQEIVKLQFTPEGSRNGIFETIILNLLEELRQLMKNGSETFPVLDPILIENINVGEDVINVPGAYIKIDDLTIADLSTFEMDHIEVSLDSLLLQRYKLEFDLSIPEVNINSESYDMWLQVFGGDIFGKGFLSLKVVRPRVKGYIIVRARLAEGISLSIHECKIGFGLDAFTTVITGLFEDEVSSEFSSAFLSQLVPEMLEFFEEQITNILSTMVFVIGNIILADIDIGSIINLQAVV